MKKIFFIVFIFFIMYSLDSCKKKDDPTPVTPDTAEYLRADIGTIVSFEADLSKTTVDTTLVVPGMKLTQINASDSLEDNLLILTFIGREAGTYQLTNSSQGHAQFNSVSQQQTFVSKTGYINVSKYDKTDGKISGTFEITMRLSGTQADTLLIKNGVFNNLSIH